VITFPDEKGRIMEYSVVETSIFSSNDNIDQHIGIKMYLGSRTDNSGTRVRFSVTPTGLKAMISEPGKETVFIQPVTKHSKNQYLVYNRSARGHATEQFECLTKDLGIEEKASTILEAKNANDQLLRTYRIAFSVTSDYTAFWDDGDATNGDDKADSLAQLVSTLASVN